MVKLIFDPESRTLLAANILGEHATELVHIPMLVMAAGGKIDTFIDAVFNFPTLSEAFKYASYDGYQRAAARRGESVRPPAPHVAGAPATRRWFLGVVAGAEPVPGSPVTVCEMDRWKRCRFSTWSYDPAGQGLVPEEAERDGVAVAVCGERGDSVVGALRPRYGVAGEVPAESAEVLRADTTLFWQTFGPRDRRTRPTRDTEGLKRLRAEILTSLGVELPAGGGGESLPHLDQLDAAAGALTAYLWASGRAPVEGGTVVPRSDV
jgi:hypothetical protein